MKAVLRLILMSTILVGGGCVIEKPEGTAKPTEVSEVFEDPAAVKSPGGEAYFPPDREPYYSRYYHAAQLPSLQFKREPKGAVKFRLAIIPSFTKPIFLTYTRSADGGVIEVTRLSMRRVDGSSEPDKVEMTGKVAVGKRIAAGLESDALDPDIRKPLGNPTEIQRQMYKGFDGCTWILEVSTDSDYTMEDIWSPEVIGNLDAETLENAKLPKVDTRAFIQFCDNLLRITDMKVPDYPIGELLNE